MKQHHPHRKHIISLYIIIVVLLASQVFTMYTLIIRTGQISSNLNQTYSEMQNNERETNSKISQLSESIISAQSDLNKITLAQSSFEKQITQLKASASSDFSGIIEQDIKGVVTVRTDIAQGTGFLLTEDGYIVTNAHVIHGARAAGIYTYDNIQHSVSLIGEDTNMDIAVLKITGTFNKLILGNSNNVKIGEKVIAIGNPLGLSFSASEGIISAVNREGSNGLPYYIQTDVALNPGNSGGPLIDKSGEVIGINNFKIGGAESLGFALESNYIKEAVNQITQASTGQAIV